MSHQGSCDFPAEIFQDCLGLSQFIVDDKFNHDTNIKKCLKNLMAPLTTFPVNYMYQLHMIKFAHTVLLLQSTNALCHDTFCL